MGNNSFKDLLDFVTFSLVRLFRNLTPPSGGCWPHVCLRPGQNKKVWMWMLLADAKYNCLCVLYAHVALFVYVLTYIFYQV